jgi:hypothetical protein
MWGLRITDLLFLTDQTENGCRVMQPACVFTVDGPYATGTAGEPIDFRNPSEQTDPFFASSRPPMILRSSANSESKNVFSPFPRNHPGSALRVESLHCIEQQRPSCDGLSTVIWLKPEEHYGAAADVG